MLALPYHAFVAALVTSISFCVIDGPATGILRVIAFAPRTIRKGALWHILNPGIKDHQITESMEVGIALISFDDRSLALRPLDRKGRVIPANSHGIIRGVYF